MNFFIGLQWWQIVIGVIVGLFLLMVLVLIHELGHAIMAVRNGVEVEEFGLGLPPRAKTLGTVHYTVRGKKFATLVTLNWLLPLGGFCRMKGESDADRRKGSFGAASFAAKTKILFAGVAVNLLAAMVIFTILAWTGLPMVDSSQFAIPMDNHGSSGIVAVASVVKRSPAERAGLKNGDEIRAISANNGEMRRLVATTTDVSNATSALAGQIVQVQLVRDGRPITKTTTLNKTGAQHGILGVQMVQKTSPSIRATWSAPLVGVIDTLQFCWMTIVGLAGLVANLVIGVFGFIVGIFVPAASSSAGAQIGAASNSVSGPLGIFGILAQGLFAGPTQLFFLMGIISLTLTVMNILPVPAFDGGRWYLLAWYKLRRKKLTLERESHVVGIGVIIIIAIFVLITLSDIVKLL